MFNQLKASGFQKKPLRKDWSKTREERPIKLKIKQVLSSVIIRVSLVP